MKLYDLEVSGNCYKVRLLAALLGVPLELIAVDFMGGEHKRPPISDLNPFQEVPVLFDGDVVLRDSQAILVYLARKHGGEAWLPVTPVDMAEVVTWLMVAENEVARGPNDARLHDKFGYKLDVERARQNAGRLLKLLDAHLAKHNWLALNRPTIADVAVMPYVALGHEGGVPADGFPNVTAWFSRIKALPGFISMPAI